MRDVFKGLIFKQLPEARIPLDFRQLSEPPKPEPGGYALILMPDIASLGVLRDIVTKNADLLGPDLRPTPPEEYHCTLRYWPASYGDKSLELKALFETEYDVYPIRCETSFFDVLGSSHALAVRLNGGDLVLAFNIADRLVQHAGLPPSAYGAFKPHVTLATGARTKSFRNYRRRIVFDRLRLAGPSHTPLWHLPR